MHGEQSVFESINNLSEVHEVLDIHGQHVQTSKNIVRQFLEEAQDKLDRGEITPNTHDGSNHIFKIICGAGNGSKNGAKLKYAIPSMLRDMDMEIFENEQHGVVLVRLQRGY